MKRQHERVKQDGTMPFTAKVICTAAAAVLLVSVVALACRADDHTNEPQATAAPMGVGRYSVLPEPEPETEATTEPVTTEPETEAVTEPEPESLGTFKLTAYCPCPKCCGEWADGITYTGTEATAGRTVAVDPKVIPLGSVVYINGREYIAEDIGGAIKGNRIDVYFQTHTEALQFGVQYAEVEIN